MKYRVEIPRTGKMTACKDEFEAYHLARMTAQRTGLLVLVWDVECQMYTHRFEGATR